MARAGLRAERAGGVPNATAVVAALSALYPAHTRLELRVITKSILFGTVSGVYEDYRLLAEHG